MSTASKSIVELCDLVVRKYAGANSRLILLDYDGTLVEIDHAVQHPYLNPETLQRLESISNQTNTQLVIISGRDRDFLERCFKSPAIDYAAEYGFYMRVKNKASKAPYESILLNSELMQTVFDYQTTNKIRIEKKESSLVLHFPGTIKTSSQDWHDFRLKINRAINSQQIEVLLFDTSIEFKNSNVNKGAAALEWLSNTSYDFILAIGNDLTDEKMFNTLPANAITIKVGYDDTTTAKYQVGDVSQVHTLLQSLANTTLTARKLS